ncbi:MAG TPA: hypothetical protein P5513_03400 [Candidatus Diapherotrites archaeon]|nr:hypothetical protein [Candidatus Diapherotrites archaeon]
MIIGISGKLQTGKNTSAHMMQFIIENYKEGLDADSMFASYLLGYGYDFKKTEQKQFASKIKQIVALLINCDVKDLEDESFKNKILSKEWWTYKLPNDQLLAYTDNNPDFINKYNLIKMTPRLMMQLIGTEGMRNIIHPNIWITSLFNDYKEDSNWLITDCRFPNEAKAIKDKGGILIRVNRLIGKIVYVIENDQPFQNWYGVVESYNGNNFYNVIDNDNDVVLVHKNQITLLDDHKSETSLDKYTEWDYIVDNNGTFKELFIKLFEILHQLFTMKK